MVISKNRIAAAKCMLPVSQRTDVPAQYGLRHRSAVGISENTDALVLIVSEETGRISYSLEGKLIKLFSIDEIIDIYTQNVN
jgi:DNA integrity scanning protein DisA with diadenylate cyclase activity